jgi:hypothetical protein
MTKEIIIILLLIALFYYYRQTKTSGNSEDLIKDLQTQLQQAHQLQTYNGEQLGQYERQLLRLKEQSATYSSEDS